MGNDENQKIQQYMSLLIDPKTAKEKLHLDLEGKAVALRAVNTTCVGVKVQLITTDDPKYVERYHNSLSLTIPLGIMYELFVNDPETGEIIDHIGLALVENAGIIKVDPVVFSDYLEWVGELPPEMMLDIPGEVLTKEQSKELILTVESFRQHQEAQTNLVNEIAQQENAEAKAAE